MTDLVVRSRMLRGIGPGGPIGAQGPQGVQGNVGPVGPDGPTNDPDVFLTQLNIGGSTQSISSSTTVVWNTTSRDDYGIHLAPGADITFTEDGDYFCVVLLDFPAPGGTGTGNRTVQFYLGATLKLSKTIQATTSAATAFTTPCFITAVAGDVLNIKAGSTQGSTTIATDSSLVIARLGSGPKGPAGPAGVPGVQGNQGLQGSQGAVGSSSSHFSTFAQIYGG